MEYYGKILIIAMPVFLALVLIETFYGKMIGKESAHSLDMVSSLSSGVTNVVKDVLGLSIVILSYSWMVDHVSVIHIKATWLVYLIAFVSLDFSGYWVHRIAHQFNFFWNNHLVHHSSEDFNLACALRQSISVFVKIFTFFLLPAALLGVPAQVIAIVAPIQLFAQFWYHTEHIHKLGFLEHILVTPSHHRVHHAINREYIDKNYSQIFIWWDKWFGTFQPELSSVPPVYGITRPVHTWNPIKINFLHLSLLIKDAWNTQSWKDKLRIWFMPTGWRPADVIDKYPVYKIEDVYYFDKYDTKASLFFKAWAWFQLTCLLLFTTYLFANIAFLNKTNVYYIYWYGLFLFLMVYAYTDLMDRSKYAWIPEVLKFLLGFYFLWDMGSWFLSTGLIKMIVCIYLIISLAITIFFIKSYVRDGREIGE